MVSEIVATSPLVLGLSSHEVDTWQKRLLGSAPCPKPWLAYWSSSDVVAVIVLPYAKIVFSFVDNCQRRHYDLSTCLSKFPHWLAMWPYIMRRIATHGTCGPVASNEAYIPYSMCQEHCFPNELSNLVHPRSSNLGESHPTFQIVESSDALRYTLHLNALLPHLGHCRTDAAYSISHSFAKARAGSLLSLRIHRFHIRL